MKKSFYRWLSVATLLCMMLTSFLPFAVFAEGEEQSAPDYIFRETFSGGALNTSGDKAALVAANGIRVVQSALVDGQFSVDSDMLNYNLCSGSYDSYFEVDHHLSELNRTLTEDFVISVWLQPQRDKIGMKFTAWQDGSSGFDILPISNGKLMINGTEYDGVTFEKDKWYLVEIVCDYDEQATAADGSQGALTHLSYMINGEKCGEKVELANKYHNVNRYRFFRYANGDFAADDLCFVRGSESQINVAKTSENNIIYRDTFSDGTVNTTNQDNNVIADDGMWANGEGAFTVEDGAMLFANDTGDNFVDIRFFLSGHEKNMTGDLTFSFWLNSLVDNLSLQFSLGEKGVGSNYNIFRIENGKFKLGGTVRDDLVLKKDEWYLIEIACNYDTANSVFSSYTVMLDGEAVGEVTAPEDKIFSKLDDIRVFRYASGQFKVDDITFVRGIQSQINVPKTSDFTYVYRNEFSGGYANSQNGEMAVSSANGFQAICNNGSSFTVEDDTLKYTEKADSDFIDLRFYLESLNKSTSRDATFSFWLKPGVDGFSSAFAWGKNGQSTDSDLFKISKGALVLGGVKSSATVAKDEWSLIEIVFNYDRTATASDGSLGAFTSYTVKLNGDKIGDITANEGKAYSAIDSFRIFRYTNGSFEIDDLSFVPTASPLSHIPRSEKREIPASKILFEENFDGGVNTDSSVEAIAVANGLWANCTDGSECNADDGALHVTKAVFRDYLALQFYHEETKIDLSRDFILSFKYKSAGANFRITWKDNAYSKYDESLRVESGRFRRVDDVYHSGMAFPDTVIEPNEWALIEIAFHYDEDLVAVTGEQGAFGFYSVILNGKYVYTASTTYNYHTIDDFKLFTITNSEFYADDVTIATENTSLADSNEDYGWEKKEYFFEKGVYTDYDYSFCVVGDIQCLSGWQPDQLNTLYDWIANNAESQNMKFVMGLGDITQWDGKKDKLGLEEWDRAAAAIAKLDGIVPYALVKGNHDGSENFNNYFYYNENYTSQFAEAGGFFGENSVENYWRALTVGKDKWLIMGLDCGPTDAELAWAGEIIAAYPDHKVIITTHNYLNCDGTFVDEYNQHAASRNEEGVNDGDDIWEKLVSQYANITMMISGHMSSDYVLRPQLTGKHGNVVTQLLIDPQELDDVLGGTGMVTMLYFKEGSASVRVETYSTVFEKYCLGENQFTLNLDGKPEIVIREEFSSSESVNLKDSGVLTAGGFRGSAVSEYTLENETFKFNSVQTSSPYNDYFDIRFTAAGFEKNLSRDFIFSVWLKPHVDKFGTQFSWTGDGVTENTGSLSTRIRNGYWVIGGKNYTEAALPKGEWSLIEIVFNYDENAISCTGEIGAITSYTYLLNGVEIATQTATKNLHEVESFRMLRYSTGSYEIDDMTVALSDHSLIDTLSPAPTVKKELGIVSAYLNLDSDINLVYRTEIPRDYKNPYMIFELNGESYTVEDYHLDLYGRYCFVFEGIAPQLMGDSIKATLYATDGNGALVSVSKESYSIKEYCAYQLANSNDSKVKTLVSDLLVYGAKAQLYMGYKTDALVTDGIAGLTASEFVTLDASANKLALSGEASELVSFSGVGLYLDNDMTVRLTFKAQSVEGLTVEIKVGDDITVVNADEFIGDGKGNYRIYFDGVMATEFDSEVTAIFKLNGEAIGQTLTYSVNSYVYYMQDNANETLGELVKAICNYGKSASAYLG